MRKAIITDLQGNPLGAIIEEDNGYLRGEGKGESLIEQAPTKTFDDWVNHTRHSTYLRLVVEEDTE
jgi:hypothetical protein